jgi:15-cis-phytoene synthase
MNNKSLFDLIAYDCSRDITRRYSTSFFSSIKLLGPEIRKPIYSIYGMVRLADEIVDTFHEHNKHLLLSTFRFDTFRAIGDGISLNPALHSFQQVVHQYNIDLHLIESFFDSMEMDLNKKDCLNDQEFKHYVYGSAEVVGLMCLSVFCNGDQKQYDSLKPYAMALGAAFQKVNFLRDLYSDVHDLDRKYFPGFNLRTFNDSLKPKIEEEISEDFRKAFQGVKLLPLQARFGVYVAYKYYLELFNKVKRSHPETVLQSRIRIPNYIKFVIVLKAGLRSQLNMF